MFKTWIMSLACSVNIYSSWHESCDWLAERIDIPFLSRIMWLALRMNTHSSWHKSCDWLAGWISTFLNTNRVTCSQSEYLLFLTEIMRLPYILNIYFSWHNLVTGLQSEYLLFLNHVTGLQSEYLHFLSLSWEGSIWLSYVGKTKKSKGLQIGHSLSNNLTRF